jgi:glycosyltransferase involved in cell wall biosynthesis
LSVCLIVRDEAENLPACLASVAGLEAEVIVVDTGSTDNTREVAERCGAKVYGFAWQDSFAAARHESLRHATGRWVPWLDADDRIEEENRARLCRLLATLGDENASYVMKCLCLPDATAPPPSWTTCASSATSPRSAGSSASTSRCCPPFAAPAPTCAGATW